MNVTPFDMSRPVALIFCCVDPAADGVPYYPLLDKENVALYAKYQALAQREERERNVVFVGRLANYKYFNMDQAIGNAIDLFERRFCGVVEPMRVRYDAAVLTLLDADNVDARLAQLSHVSSFITTSSNNKNNLLWMVLQQSDEPDIEVHRRLEQLAARYVYLPAGSADLQPSAARISRWQRAFAVAARHLRQNDLHRTPVYCVPPARLGDATSMAALDATFACSDQHLPLAPPPPLRVCALAMRSAVDTPLLEPHAQRQRGRFFELTTTLDATPAAHSRWTLLYVDTNRLNTDNNNNNNDDNNDDDDDRPLLLSRQFHRIETIALNCDVAVWLDARVVVHADRFFEQIDAWSRRGHHLLQLQLDGARGNALMFDLRMPMTATLLDQWHTLRSNDNDNDNDNGDALQQLADVAASLELTWERINTSDDQRFAIIQQSED
jgi:hypothetical protein